MVYFRPESVALAVQMLDDTDFRFGVENPAGRMKVEAANFSYKKEGSGEKNGGTAPEDKKNNPREKRKVIAKTQKLNKYVFPHVPIPSPY